MINAELFIAASSVFSNTNWECCGGGQIEEYALFKRHTKHDFGFDWIVLLGKDGGSFSDSLCLFWAGYDSPSFVVSKYSGIQNYVCMLDIRLFYFECV